MVTVIVTINMNPPLSYPCRLPCNVIPYGMRCRDTAGFSLVEMAVVIVLMSMMLTLGVAALSVQQDNAAISATQKKQEAIKDALVAYLRTYKRLPCPETSTFPGNPANGSESRQSPGDAKSLCQSYWGTVPYATLGLSRETALDGYDNLFTYFVSAAQAGEPDWTLTQASSSVPGFSAGNPGRYAVTENGAPTTLSANLAVVVIISHGKNGAGAFTIKGTRNELPTGTDELTNAWDIPPSLPNLPNAWQPPSTTATTPPNPSIATLIQRDRSDLFDDIVLVIRPNDLLQPLIKDGAMKSAEALIQDQLLMVRDTAIAKLLSNSCKSVPSLSSAELPIDPWGNPINYTSVDSTTQLTGTAPSNLATTAFRIWSFGANRTNDTSATASTVMPDDQALSTGLDVTFAQIRARLPATACP